MTPKRERFVQEYLKDGNATQAAFRAGYSQDTAYSIGYDLLRYPEVYAAISAARDEMAERASFAAVDVLKRWVAIATADPNELVRHRIAPCRHCNGVDGRFQWKTQREFDEAAEAAVLAEKPALSAAGGFGYSVKAPVNPDCPECGGDGVGYALFADTSTLSPQARMLYAGVKQTKDGMEIKMHDQLKALENVARHLGMFEDKLNITGKLTIEQTVERQALRQALLRELTDLARPEPLTIEHEKPAEQQRPGGVKPPAEWG